MVQCSVNWLPLPSRLEISKCLNSCKDCDFALPGNPLRQISTCFASQLLVIRHLELSELFPDNDDSSLHRSAQSKRGNLPRSSQENAQCKVAPQGLQHTADFRDTGTNERTVRSHTSPTSEAAQFCAAWFPWQRSEMIKDATLDATILPLQSCLLILSGVNAYIVFADLFRHSGC